MSTMLVVSKPHLSKGTQRLSAFQEVRFCHDKRNDHVQWKSLQGWSCLVTIAAGTTKAAEDVCPRHRLFTLRAMRFHHSDMCEGACSVVVHAYVNCSLARAPAGKQKCQENQCKECRLVILSFIIMQKTTHFILNACQCFAIICHSI